LLAEFYWTWHDDQNKQNYRTFSEKLREENKTFLISWRVFNGSLPKAYPCPFIGSCKVRLNAAIPYYISQNRKRDFVVIKSDKSEWKNHRTLKREERREGKEKK
jgi:hypothetical protein